MVAGKQAQHATFDRKLARRGQGFERRPGVVGGPVGAGVGGIEGGIGIGVAAVFDGLARVVGTGVGIARVDGVGGTIGAPARLGGLSTGAGGGRP